MDKCNIDLGLVGQDMHCKTGMPKWCDGLDPRDTDLGALHAMYLCITSQHSFIFFMGLSATMISVGYIKFVHEINVVSFNLGY